MPDSLVQQKIYPYDGDLITAKPPLLLSPKDVVEANNVVYSIYGTKKKRPGIRQAFGVSTITGRKIINGCDFHRLGTQFVIQYDGKKIIAIDPKTGTWDDIGSTIPIPTDEMATFTVFQGFLIVCFYGGETQPYYWTGSGKMIEITDAPAGAFARVWLNKLWIPNPEVEGRVLHSKTNDPLDFSTGDAGEVDFDVNDGDPEGITALFPPFFTIMYVSKGLSLFSVVPQYTADGDLFFVATKVFDSYGCLSHSAVVSRGQRIYFPSSEGFHIIESSDRIQGVEESIKSWKIQNLYQDEINLSRARYITAAYDPSVNTYIMAYPPTGQNFSRSIMGYSDFTDRWVKWEDIEQGCVFRYVDRTSKKLRVMAGSLDSRLGYFDKDYRLDYDRPIDVRIQSGIIAPSGSPDDQFGFHHIAPIFIPQLAGTFQIILRVDSAVVDTLEFDMVDSTVGDDLGVDFIPGQSVLGGLPRVKIDKRSTQGNGMLYEMIIYHKALADEGFELLGVLTDLSPTTKSIGATVA